MFKRRRSLEKFLGIRWSNLGEDYQEDYRVNQGSLLNRISKLEEKIETLEKFLKVEYIQENSKPTKPYYQKIKKK